MRNDWLGDKCCSITTCMVRLLLLSICYLSLLDISCIVYVNFHGNLEGSYYISHQFLERRGRGSLKLLSVVLYTGRQPYTMFFQGFAPTSHIPEGFS